MPDGEKRVTVHLSVAPWVAELLRGIRKPGRVVDNLVESADGSWEGKCVSLNELNEAFARMGVKPDAKQLAKVSAEAGDALRLFLASEQGKETK